MGNTIGKKRKMGSPASKRNHGQTKKEGLLGPLARSFSMPVHKQPQKSDNYHVVALTSSTYGILKVDLPREAEEGRTPEKVKRNPVEEMYEKMRSLDMTDLTAPKSWSEVDDVLSKLKTPSYTGKHLQQVGESVDELETINMWELMEGLEDDPVSPEPVAAAPLKSPAIPNTVKTLESSLSFSAIHTVTEVDAKLFKSSISESVTEEINGLQVSEIVGNGKGTGTSEKTGKVSDTSESNVSTGCSDMARKTFSVVGSTSLTRSSGIAEAPALHASEIVRHVRTSGASDKPAAETVTGGKSLTGSLVFKNASGKENAERAASVQRVGTVSTLTPMKMNSSVSAQSSVLSKGSVSSKVNSTQATPQSSVGATLAPLSVERVPECKISNLVSSAPTPDLRFRKDTSNGSDRMSHEALSRSTSAGILKQKVDSTAYSGSPLNFSALSSILDDQNKNMVPGSPLFDPDLLASFEKAIDEVSEDDWYTVRRSDAEAASTSGSSSDGDSPVRIESTGSKVLGSVLETASLTRKVEPDGNARKMSFSKVTPLEFEEKKAAKVDPLEKFDYKCPPGGEERVVLYFTSLRGIRKTFEDCSNMKMIINGCGVSIDERDVSIHTDFRQELKELFGKPVPVPRLFIKGRYIGGAEEVSQFHEDGTLGQLLEGLPTQLSWQQCDGCGGVRFVPCSDCSGSCKFVTEDKLVVRCTECNENGLMRCPICF